MKRLWLVRAGRNGEREQIALNRSILAPGFTEVADLTPARDREAIAALVARAYPDASTNAVRNFSAQLNQFRNAMAVGDLVVMPRKLTPTVAMGIVTGEYVYDADEAVRQTRRVDWKRTDVPREVFKQDLKHSFGAFMTICQISRNEALKRVEAVLANGADPGAVLGKEGKVSSKTEPAFDDPEEFDIDIEDVANQQLVQLIKSQFAGHELANLVSEILQVEGYTVRVSPPGPDGGRDILAADGPLGFGDRRICVQVKSGDVTADISIVLSLQGAMTNAKAQTGLLVSLAGVKGPAQKVLDDNFFSIRLWQMPELLSALYRTYDRLSDETKAKLPLKQIWIPVPRDDEGI